MMTKDMTVVEEEVRSGCYLVSSLRPRCLLLLLIDAERHASASPGSVDLFEPYQRPVRSFPLPTENATPK